MNRRSLLSGVGVAVTVPVAGCVFGEDEPPEVGIDVHHLGANDYTIEVYVELNDAESVDFYYDGERLDRVLIDSEEITGDKYDPMTIANVEGGGTLEAVGNMDDGEVDLEERQIG